MDYILLSVKLGVKTSLPTHPVPRNPVPGTFMSQLNVTESVLTKHNFDMTVMNRQKNMDTWWIMKKNETDCVRRSVFVFSLLKKKKPVKLPLPQKKRKIYAQSPIFRGIEPPMAGKLKNFLKKKIETKTEPFYF